MASAGTDERLLDTMRRVAPGTPLREGLDSVLRGRTGALVVVEDGPEIMAMADGGFRLDAPFHPSSLYELAKMDGAIILSEDGQRIVRANVHLHPDPGISSAETGIRHRAAERVARQTGALVIAISARRNVISVYRGGLRYLTRDLGYLLTVGNQAVQTLERTRSSLDQALNGLSTLEFDDLVVVADVAGVMQKIHATLRVMGELEHYAAELGEEGRLITMQLERLSSGVEEESLLCLRDYCPVADDAGYLEMFRELRTLPRDVTGDRAALARRLGLASGPGALETPVSPRGYRLLSRIPRLPMGIIENLIKRYGAFPRIAAAGTEDLDGVEGIGESRAQAIVRGLARLRETLRRSPQES
ncbi:MAG: DNA integrity scanning diadenylate cyclase DisA [bacterium]|nr:DNA integrity scanning diadenylate cyclase DisA [bacterium]